SGEVLEILARLTSSHSFKSSIMDFERACLAARRTFGAPPRISASIAYSLLTRPSASVAIGALPTYMDLVEPPSHVAPTKGERHRTAGTRQFVVSGIAVDLQYAAEAFKQRDGVLLASPWRISVGNRRRLGAAPGPIVARNRPQEAGFGL